MRSKPRTLSILQAKSLDTTVTGLPSFDLAKLDINGDLDMELPTNLRLGHLAEKVVSELIKASSNYAVLHENIQVLDGKQTIGELDFILKEKATQQTIHMELAYKFYLFDPNISTDAIHNWIGPNRNDSLAEKLHKLKTKQFPLLHHPCTRLALDSLDTSKVSQALCLLASLYLPYEYSGSFSPAYQKAIRGYYLDLDTFSSLDTEDKTYHIPPKKEWGIDPSENEVWTNYTKIKDHISTCIQEKQAPLCWQKQGDTYTEFFIVWW
jgi:hypothetical protein